MTKEEFEKKLPLIRPYDFIFVHINEDKMTPADIQSWWVQRSGRFCHVEVKMPDVGTEENIVLCAGSNGVAFEKFKKYLARPASYTLVVARLKGLTEDNRNKMWEEVKNQIKKNTKYDWMGIYGMAIKTFLTKIPVIGFFINQFIWKLPSLHDENKLYCCESAGRIGRAPKKNGKIKYKLPFQVPPGLFFKFKEFQKVTIIGEEG